MKLHQLIIQAFGPFAGREIINFDDLGQNPLFLIDGPTGAGKSSILHAISFALYGETTDSDRKSVALRCDHADGDRLTELSLEFSIRGERYQISRIPTQMRPAKRGGGETEQKSSAQLMKVLADGSEKNIVAKKVSEADRHIEEIIGLTVKQFLQVMVLPQGQFRKLLLAKSDERQTILSALFQTEIFKQIELILKTKAASIVKQNDAFELRKKEALSDNELDDVESLDLALLNVEISFLQQQKLKHTATGFKQHSLIVLNRANELMKRFSEYGHKQQEFRSHQQQSETILAEKNKVEKAEKANSISLKWSNLQHVRQELATKTKQLSETAVELSLADKAVIKSAAELQQAEHDYKQNDALTIKLTLLQSYQQRLPELLQLQQNVKQITESYQQALKAKTVLSTTSQHYEARAKQLKDEIDLLVPAIQLKAELIERKHRAELALQSRLKLDKLHSLLISLTDKNALEKETLKQAEKAYKSQAEKANRIEIIWLNNQAAVLASKLDADSPCTVCGSELHPHLAQFTEGEENINQQRVDSARAEELACRKNRDSCKEKVTENESAITIKNNDIEQLKQELNSDLENDVDVLKTACQTVNSSLNDIAQKEKQADNLTVKIQQENHLLQQNSEQLNTANHQLEQLNVEKAVAEQALLTAMNELKEEYRQEGVIEKELSYIVNKINSIKANLKAGSEDLMQSRTQQSALNSTKAQLEKESQTLQISVQLQSAEWLAILAASQFENQDDFEHARMADEALDKVRQLIKDYDGSTQRIATELGLLESQLDGQQQPNIVELESQFNQAEHDLIVCENDWLKVQEKKNRLIELQVKINNIDTQQSAIKKEYEIVGSLSVAASGGAALKVSLERFVLGNILDSVLSVASQRLYHMTKGQYRLIRQDEKTQSKNVTAGLNLAIDDSYTGKIRPVNTLSGGESFLASLALALGLSDVVQERSGGIQLDTLFIDEGFGSLDPESLQLAIDTLIDLQSSGRTIGIISHVAELKEQMQQRIEVVGSRQGSSITLVS